MEFLFYTCDVFTDQRFGGNQLAVLPDARGLSDIQMQQIAREFNFSETTFVLPPEKGNTRRLRIFTPRRELGFAGHPNIGTAFVLAMTDPQLKGAEEFVFEELAGLVKISLNHNHASPWCELRAPQPLIIGEAVPLNLVAQALGLPPQAILTSQHQPRVCSAGMPFVIAELADEEFLASIRIESAPFRTLEKYHHCGQIHAYTRTQQDTYNTRMFAPLIGVEEDPATGSANCTLAGLLAACSAQTEGELTYTFTQGLTMGRPSLLKARALKENGKVSTTWIGGHSVMVSQGTLFLD